VFLAPVFVNTKNRTNRKWGERNQI